MTTWHALVERLELKPHPEGGYFRETFRSSVKLQTPKGERAAMTSIHFLLPAGAASAWHRVSSDEVWHHVSGDPIELQIVGVDGLHVVHRLHASHADGMTDHVVVPANAWQAARPIGSAAGYALVSCDVAPGFDFADFEMGTPDLPRGEG